MIGGSKGKKEMTLWGRGELKVRKEVKSRIEVKKGERYGVRKQDKNEAGTSLEEEHVDRDSRPESREGETMEQGCFRLWSSVLVAGWFGFGLAGAAVQGV